MTHFPMAILLFPWLSAPVPAPAPPAAYFEPAAVLLNLSERDLNRIVVDSFHAAGGSRVVGGRARVSASVTDLRYRASLSDPVLRLGADRSVRLSLDILDASLRFGRLERKIAGRGARCEEAGIDVDPARPLRVDLTLDLAIERGALRILPRSVEIPDVEERLRLVRPTRCTNSVLPTRILWWVGRPFVRRSVDRLDRVLLERARKGAARLESREGLRGGWRSEIHLFPEILLTTAGSLLVGLTASGADAAADAGPPRGLDLRGSLPSGSFVGLSESFVNEVARRIVSDWQGSTLRTSVNARRFLASDAACALIPGLRGLASREHLELAVVFREAPRFEFRTLDDGQPLIRVLASGLDIDVRRSESGRMTRLGTLHVDSGGMAAVPFANLLGGISFRLVENRWRVSSTGLDFDHELVGATLQEIVFGRIFETSYRPLLRRAMSIGDTEFLPRSFAVVDRYLVIGMGGRSPEVATQTGSLPGSR